jgi:predicted secreted protein
MVRKFIVCWVFVLAAVFAAGSVFAQGTPVQLSVGETRTLEFEGNPSTGYSWVLGEVKGGDGRVVSVDVKGYVRAAARQGERPRLGAPAPFQVLLKGVAQGRASLTFNYVKPGSGEVASTRSFAVEVLDEAAAQQPDIDAAQEDALEDPTSSKPAESNGDLFADPNDLDDGGGLDE